MEDKEAWCDRLEAIHILFLWMLLKQNQKLQRKTGNVKLICDSLKKPSMFISQSVIANTKKDKAPFKAAVI